MKSTTNRKWRLFAMCASVGLGLLLGGGRSVAQGMGGSSTGGSGGFGGGGSGGGMGGSSLGGAGFGGASSFGGAGFGGSSSFGGAGFSGSGFGSGSFGSNSSFGSSAFGNAGSTFSSFSGGGASRSNTNTNTGFPTVGTTNAFLSYYLNPMAQGLVGGPTGSSQHEFGTPLYGTNALATTTTTTVTPTTVTFAPAGSPLLAPYVFSMTPTSTGGAAVSMNASPLLGELRQILDRSSALASVRSNIQVGSAGGVIVLRGRVSDEHERRIAEGLMRLTPGVREVRNELIVPTTTLPPPMRSGG